jgi:MFS family permease
MIKQVMLGRDTKILGLIGTGHFLSHFYILTLPPLFPLIKADYGLSFVQLGLLMTVFNAAAAAVQVPVGLLVDRIGPRTVLIGGLLLEAGAIGAMGFVPGYQGLLILAVIAGLGHSVFHPADYFILISRIDHSHIGRAFSIHTFMGSAGSAVAPAVVIFLTALWNWKIALMIVAAVGIATAFTLASQMSALEADVLPRRGRRGKNQDGDTPGHGTARPRHDGSGDYAEGDGGHHIRVHVIGPAARRDVFADPVRLDHRSRRGALAVLAVRRDDAGGIGHTFHAAPKNHRELE